MVVMRAMSWRDRAIIFALAVAIGMSVYIFTNPYVLINYFSHRERLMSNLSNSTAMYAVGDLGFGMINGLRMIFLGASPVVAAAGIVGGGALLILRTKSVDDSGKRALVVLMTVICAVILVQFLALADHKPAEYARFSLLPDVGLMIAAVCAGHAFVHDQRRRRAVLLMIPVVTAFFGLRYVEGFLKDSSMATSRVVAAEKGRVLVTEGTRIIAVTAEPAPYCVPPVNLFDAVIVLTPVKGRFAKEVEPEVMVGKVERGDAAPISWANKRFEFFRLSERRELFGSPVTITSVGD
jgi:hypothetical protein